MRASLPAAASLVLSFTDFDIYALADLSNLRFVGLQNYEQLVANPLFWKAMGNTLWFVLLGVPLSALQYYGREILIEQDPPNRPSGRPRGTEYKAIRTDRFKFVRYWNDEVELYDLVADPYELDNLARDPAYEETQRALSKRLEKLGTCAGKSCRTKPAMKLQLPDEIKRGDKRCRRAGDFVAAVKRPGDDRWNSLVRVSFRVDGTDAGTLTGRPFKSTLSRRLLREQPKPLIEADAELVDGRILTLAERVRICG